MGEEADADWQAGLVEWGRESASLDNPPCRRCSGYGWLKLEDPCYRCQGSGIDPEPRPKS